MSRDFATVLAAAKAGEGWAFDDLFKVWNRPITAFVRQRGVIDSDDVANEVFLGAFRSIGRFRGGEGEFRSWIFRIARNKIADHHRAAGRRPETVPLQVGFMEPTQEHVEADVARLIGDERVAALLSHLTDEQREVLILRTVADLTVDQVASVIGKRRGAVKQLQRRGLRRLEAILAESAEGASQ